MGANFKSRRALLGRLKRMSRDLYASAASRGRAIEGLPNDGPHDLRESEGDLANREVV